jgi:hypothetical protein
MRAENKGRPKINAEKLMSRNNPNIEDPGDGGGRNPDVENPDVDILPEDPQPVPPDQPPEPPIEEPPDQPGKTGDEPDPPPIGDPKPNEPTRLV